MEECEDAEAVRRNVEAFLGEVGFEIDEDSLRGFDAAQFPQDG